MKLKEWPMYIKSITAVVVFALSIGGVIFAAEDRYVTDKEAASSLKMFQQQLQYENNVIKLELEDLRKTMIRKELDYVKEQYYKLKQLIINNPDDMELQLEFEDIKAKKIKLETELY